MKAKTLTEVKDGQVSVYPSVNNSFEMWLPNGEECHHIAPGEMVGVTFQSGRRLLVIAVEENMAYPFEEKSS